MLTLSITIFLNELLHNEFIKKKTVFYFYKIIDKKNYSVIYCDLTTLLAIKKTLYIQYQQQITMPTNGFFLQRFE